MKLLLHQGGHITPAHNTNKVEMYVGSETYHEILNEWFSHYLCGVDNGAPDRPEVTVQSNVDGSWLTVDSWRTDSSYTWDPTSTGTKTIKSTSTNTNTSSFQTAYLKQSDNVNVYESMTVSQDMTIQGVVEVNLKAAPADNYGTKEVLMMSVFLVDVSNTSFNAFPTGVEGYNASNFNFHNEYFTMGGGAERYQRGHAPDGRC